MNSKVRSRKIIQIQALRFTGIAADGIQSSQETELVALCDDGTVWTRTSTITGEWCQVGGIPDDDLRHEAWLKDIRDYLVKHKGIRQDVAPTLLQERHAHLKSAFESGDTMKSVAEAILAELHTHHRPMVGALSST